MAGLATNMRAGEIELIAQEVDQQGARLDQSFDVLAVHFQFDLGFGHHSLPWPRTRDLARSSARVSMTPAILVRYCPGPDRKSTRLNSSHMSISYAVFCL